MDTLTPPEAAAQLGVSLPAVHRLLDTMHVPRHGRGIPRAVSSDQLDVMRRSIGAAPDRPAALDRVQVLVLTALSRAALGLESQRAVARAAGVSPGAAGRALTALSAAGLVTKSRRKVARGVPTAIDFWTVTHAVERDPALRRAVRTTRLPASEARAHAKRVPHRFAHLFWNADLAALDPRVDGAYIAQRLLDTGDTDAQVWALENIDEVDLRRAIAVRGTDPQVSRFVRNVLESR